MSATKAASSAKTATNDTTVINKEQPLCQSVLMQPHE